MPIAPIMHLELHTGNLARACSFYSRLFGWAPATIETGAGPYVTLGVGERVDGGVVECGTARELWLPYVRVEEIHDATARAGALGAAVRLAPREGPAGWRSVISAPSGAEIALWQPKG